MGEVSHFPHHNGLGATIKRQTIMFEKNKKLIRMVLVLMLILVVLFIVTSFLFPNIDRFDSYFVPTPTHNLAAQETP